MKEQSEQDFIVEKFSYESLEKLSKAELIDIVYRLQDALVDLRVTVCGYAQIGMHKPLYEIARNIEKRDLAKSWDKAECKKTTTPSTEVSVQASLNNGWRSQK